MAYKKDIPTPGSKLNFRNWRISTKLLVVMLILILVPLLIVTAIGTRTGVLALEEEEHVNLTRLANSTAQRINQLLSDNHNALRMTANQPAITDYLESSENNRGTEDFETVNLQIDNLYNSNPPIDLVSVFDTEGYVVAHTDDYYLNKRYKFRDYVQAGLKGNQYTSGILIGIRDGTPGLISSTPITDSSVVIGVLSDRIEAAYITDILQSTVNYGDSETDEYAASTEVYLINNYGIVMSHSNPDSPWLYRSLGEITDEGDINEIKSNRILGLECIDGAETCDETQQSARSPEPIPAAQDFRNELLTALEFGIIGSTEYCRPTNIDVPVDGSGCDGNSHIVGYAPVEAPGSENGNLFMVVVDIPADIFLNNIYAFIRQGALVAIITAILGVIVALVVARMLGKPIGKLARVAQDVEEDKPFEPSELTDVMSLGDEVGHLARVFSAMVLALRARMAELRTIFEIGQEISAGVDFEETLMYILSAIHDVIPYDMAELGFYEEKEKRMVVRAAADFESEESEEAIKYFEPETARFYDVNEGILARLVEKRSALLISNMAEDEDLEMGAERKWGGKEARSYLGVVLKAKGKVIGSIELISSQLNKFNEDNSRLLSSIAVQAAIEVQNAQEVQEREQRLAQQIQQMDIVIDKEKQSEQITDIVGSDFFKTAQDKAKEARGKKSSK